jgi:oral-facial-digital syndrome 1 protein
LQGGRVAGVPQDVHQKYLAAPNLQQQIANNLIGQYLEKSGLRNSLAVFLPESGISMPFMTKQDILQHFRLDRHTAALTNGEADEEAAEEDSPILSALLDGIEKQMRIPTCDGGTQTELYGPDHREMLEGKLRIVQVEYLAKSEHQRDGPHRTAEQRFLSYQQEVDERSQRDLESEMQRFKDNEMMQIRIDAQQHARRELTAKHQELERKFAARISAVQKREQELENVLQRKTRDVEAELYDQRQEMLMEMDRVRIKEDQMKQSLQLDSRSVRIERQELEEQEQKFEHQCNELSGLRLELQESAERQLDEWKLQVTKSMSNRDERLRDQELGVQRRMEVLERDEKAHATDLSKHHSLVTAKCRARSSSTTSTRRLGA